MPIFGITASSNMSIKLTDFYQIATTTLGSAQSTIDFTSIPQDYSHLQIRGIARDNTASTSTVDFRIRLNNDSATNYTRHLLYGSGSSATGSGVTGSNYIAGLAAQGASTTNVFAGNVIDILDYTNTNKNTTLRTILGVDLNGSGDILLNSGVWLNTSAVSRITLSSIFGSFAQYSSFALYGIKG
jgi:hypothetical protein